MQPPKAMILPQIILKIRSDSTKSFIPFNVFYVILKSFVCNSYVNRMYSYATRMSLVCHSYVTRMHSYALVFHLYVNRMYSYVIRMLLVCGFTMNRYKVIICQMKTYIYDRMIHSVIFLFVHLYVYLISILFLMF